LPLIGASLARVKCRYCHCATLYDFVARAPPTAAAISSFDRNSPTCFVADCRSLAPSALRQRQPNVNEPGMSSICSASQTEPPGPLQGGAAILRRPFASASCQPISPCLVQCPSPLASIPAFKPYLPLYSLPSAPPASPPPCSLRCPFSLRATAVDGPVCFSPFALDVLYRLCSPTGVNRQLIYLELISSLLHQSTPGQCVGPGIPRCYNRWAALPTAGIQSTRPQCARPACPCRQRRPSRQSPLPVPTLPMRCLVRDCRQLHRCRRLASLTTCRATESDQCPAQKAASDDCS
jgi:hypothetical protein